MCIKYIYNHTDTCISMIHGLTHLSSVENPNEHEEDSIPARINNTSWRFERDSPISEAPFGIRSVEFDLRKDHIYQDLSYFLNHP